MSDEKPFFTMADFCDDGGYLKSPKYCVEHANRKVAPLIEALKEVVRDIYPKLEWNDADLTTFKAVVEAMKGIESK